MVECLLAKEDVASSNLVSRSILQRTQPGPFVFRAAIVAVVQTLAPACFMPNSCDKIRLYQSPARKTFAILRVLLVGSPSKLVYYRQMFAV